mmetsp:Transcript_1684/g.5128  ORF Transcript_1684/g.5128 Transcript_1684/m.5128 type:complete len:253 (+) Transcript_1684:439-1197(+)
MNSRSSPSSATRHATTSRVSVESGSRNSCVALARSRSSSRRTTSSSLSAETPSSNSSTRSIPSPRALSFPSDRPRNRGKTSATSRVVRRRSRPSRSFSPFTTTNPRLFTSWTRSTLRSTSKTFPSSPTTSKNAARAPNSSLSRSATTCLNWPTASSAFTKSISAHAASASRRHNSPSTSKPRPTPTRSFVTPLTSGNHPSCNTFVPRSIYSPPLHLLALSRHRPQASRAERSSLHASLAVLSSLQGHVGHAA